MEGVVDPLINVAVIDRNLDRSEKYTDKSYVKFKKGNAKSGTLGGIIPSNRTGWGLTASLQRREKELWVLMDKLKRSQQCALIAMKVNHRLVCTSRNVERTSSRVILHFHRVL